MSIFLSLTAALGACLFFSGTPLAQRATLKRRTDPFLRHLTDGGPGPHGRLSGVALQHLTSNADRRNLARRLESAGLNLSPERFRVEQIVHALGAAGTACLLVLAASSLGAAADLRALPVFAGLMGSAGFLWPDYRLGRRERERKERLVAGLPVATDLLALSIMAGESILGAFSRVAEVTSGEIQAEFARVCADVRSGTPAVGALEEFGRRSDCPPVARLVDALCVAIESGAPVADVLRAQADDAREVQRRALMELAGRREILMLVPIVFLLLPTVVIFVFFPGLVSLDLLVS